MFNIITWRMSTVLSENVQNDHNCVLRGISYYTFAMLYSFKWNIAINSYEITRN